MPDSPSKTLPTDVDKALEDVVRELKRAARDPGGDIEVSITKAAEALNRAAHALADDALEPSVAKAQTSMEEVKRHPVAAAAALVGVAATARRTKAS